MTRQQRLIYRLFYALALLPLLLVQELCATIPLPFAAPSLLPLAVGCVALREGAEFGAGYGLYAGFFYALGQPEGAPYLFLLSLLGYACGLLREQLPGGFVGAFCMALLCLFTLDFLRALYWMLARGAGLAAALGLVGAELLVSLLCFPFVYLLYHFCHEKTRHLHLQSEEAAA